MLLSADGASPILGIGATHQLIDRAGQAPVQSTVDVAENVSPYLSADPGATQALLSSSTVTVRIEPEIRPEQDVQWVYLDFDGAQDVDYHGPVTVEGMTVAAFRAPDGLVGRESEIIGSVQSALDSAFAALPIRFTIEAPLSGPYSTVHVGGDGSAFSAWGNYLGLSEKVDTGNTDRSDKAFVFSENIAALSASAGDYGRLLAAYIAHETGHLVGLEHEHEVDDGSDPLAEVAFKPYTHVEVARDVLADLTDDGKITLLGRQYDVHPSILAALQAYPEYYFAGTVGPDGFPDFLMGQSVIHPSDTGTWATRVLDMAWKAQTDASYSVEERKQILSWSYGFLTHAAGDHFAHTLVNEFAEGIFPDFADIVGDAADGDTRALANALRHFLVEGYVGDATTGFDNNPDRDTAPGGDVSNDSTPGIPYGAPTRFIFETLIRPFAEDPSFLADSAEASLTVNAAANKFVRTEGSFSADGFVVGQRVTTAGFAANNGTYTVTAVTALEMTVSEDLVAGDEAAAQESRIVVRVPHTAKTTLDVNAGTNEFTRSSGSFLVDGFVAGMRFAATGFGTNDGDYRVTAVTATRITVDKDLVAGDEAGSGDEQLIVQGKRGPAIDRFLSLRYELEKQVAGRVRGDFGALVADVIDRIASGTTIPGTTLQDLFTSYLYNWIDNIDAGLAHWGEFGLATTKALFDAQSKRDLQNEEGEPYGAETDITRADREDAVGMLSVVMNELDDPNGDGLTNDSFINVHLLPMLGIPNELAFVRTAMQTFGSALNEGVIEPLQLAFNPINAAVAEIKEAVTDYIKDQVKERFGFDFETFEYLTNLASKMDLQSIEIAGRVIPVFKPGDREKLEAYLGLSGDIYEDPPAGYDAFPGVEFYDDAKGPLKDGIDFDKSEFAAYANSVTLSKLLLLSEDPVDGSTIGAGQISKVMSDELTALNGGLTVTYDYSLLNQNGAHGGNIMTTTLPGIADGSPWLTSIDQDHGWRSDSLTTTSLLYRVNEQNTGAAKAVWQAAVTPGSYAIQASWLANVTQGFTPATNAVYKIFNGATQVGTVSKNQLTQSNDLDDGGLGFENLGTFNITSGTLRVELENAAAANGNVIAGPIRYAPAGGGAATIVKFVRDPETLAVTPSGYSESGSGWVDVNYPTGTGSSPINPKFETGTNNFPLWESEVLRPVYRALFEDWQNGALDFPALGDQASDDPNTTPSVVADPLAAFTTDFGPLIETPTIEVPIPDSVKDALLDGVAQLVQLAETVGEPDFPLAAELPLIDASLADIVDLDGRLRTRLQQPLQNYFDGDSTPTFGELFNALGTALPGRLDNLESVVEFDFDLLESFVQNDLALNLGTDASGRGISLDASANIDLSASIGFADAANVNIPKFRFGVDLSSSSADVLDRFYIKADRLVVSGSASASDVDFGARIGFLGAGINDGDIDLDARVEVLFNDPNADGRITGSEIVDTPFDTLLTANATGSFNATLPLQVETGLGIDPNLGTITLSATDIFDTDTLDAHFTGNFDQFDQFNNLTAADLLGLVQQFVTQIGEIKDSAAMQELFGLPVAGAALENALDFADMVSDALLYDDLDDTSAATGVAKLLDASGNPTFTTAQEFAERLASILGLDPSVIGAHYDAATKQLTFHLRIAQTLVDVSSPLELNFDLESGLADFDASTNASVDANFTFDFGLGIDLDFDPATEDLADHVYIEDAQLNGTLNLAAEDIDAAARFGFLSIAIVDGSATGTATIDLRLTDPKTNADDDRIDISELVGGASIEDLFDVTFHGGVSIALPVSAPFLGITPSDDTTITLEWTDVSDPSTIDVQIPNFLEGNVGRFNNMNAGSLVSLLAQITSWLSDLQSTDAFSVDVPLIGDAVRGALQLGDLIQKALMYDDNGTPDDLTDDTAKLLDKDNNPRFTTAQQLAERLVEILGSGSPVTWDAARESIVVDLSLQRTFVDVDTPLDFNIDLGAIGDVTGDGALKLSADGELGIRLGIYLGEEGYVTLSESTLLSSLKGGAITFNKDRVIAAPEEVKNSYGQLTDDAKFKLNINNAASDVEVTVTKAAAETNQTIDDLLVDINAALAAAGVASQVQAAKDGNRVVLNAQGGVTALKYKSASSAAAQLGFATNQTGDTVEGQLRVRAQSELIGRPGRLSGDATFTVAMNSVNGGSPVTVTVPKSETPANMSILDVVNDVQNAIDNVEVGGVQILKNKVVVGSEGRRLTFTAKEPGTTSFVINASGVAVSELGLGTANTGSPADIVITTRDGVRREVNFDALTDTATLGDVINAIESQTGGRVQVEFTDENSRLRLRDTSPSGSAVFRIDNAIGSNAASLLGILGSDVVDPDDPDETPDHIIDSAPLGGVDILDRLFIEDAHARAGFEIDTPDAYVITAANEVAGGKGQLTADAQFTITSNSLNGGAGVAVSVSVADTAANANMADIVTDVQAAIDNVEVAGVKILKGKVFVGDDGERLIFRNEAEGTTSFTITASGTAVSELGLAPTGTGEAEGVVLAAKFGFVGVSLKGDGHLEGEIRMDLQDPGTSRADGKITLKELIDGLDDIDTLIDAPEVNGNGNLTFSVDLEPSFGLIQTGAEPTVTVDITDIGDPFDGQAPVISITTSGFDQLGNFDDIGFADVLEALRSLVDFLQEFEEFGFLNEQIPLINVSVNDMLGYAEEFAAALDQVEANPAGTVQFLEQKLKEAFNMPQDSDVLGLSLIEDGTDTFLRFDLTFKPGFSESLPIGFELPTQAFELSGGADLRTQGNLDLTLAFGLNLADPTEIVVFGDTGIQGHIDAGAEDISFAIGLGDPDGGPFIGGKIVGGSLGIEGNFGLTLKDSALTGSTDESKRILLTDLLSDLGGSVDVGMSIDVDGTLPVYFPTESLYRGDIVIGGHLSASIDDGLVIGGTAGPSADQFIYVAPEILTFDFSQFSAMDNLLLIIDGVDGFLALLQDFLDGEVAGLKMPLIGDKLSSAATFIEDFRESFIDELRNVVETANDPSANFISVKLYELLHDTIQINGQGILGDRNEDGEITVEDIGLNTNIDEPGVPLREIFMDWDIQLGGNLVTAGTGIDFDLGIPGLGLETRGAIEVSVDWEVNFGFGIGGGKGFYLKLDNPDELRMDIDVTLPGAGITGTLGFLQVDASDNGNTGLGASIAVDLYTTTGEDERVGITDFGNIRLNAGVAAEANVDLGLELRLNNELIPNAESAFPKLQADFVLEWAIGDRDAGEFVSFSAIGDSIQEGLKLVEFRNIGMDMGTFISQYVQPIVKEVQKITEPLQPLIDALTTPIPVISDLAGKPMTLIDIAQAITPPEKFNVGLIRDIAGFITLINNIPTDTDTLFIPFGGFKVYDINNPNLRGNLSSRNSTVRQTLTPTNTSSYDFNQTMSQLQSSNPGASRTTTFTKNLGNQTFGQMISFPIITDPGQIFGLLMGNDVTLVRIDPQPLLFDFRYSQFFPIWGPLGAAIEGRFNVAIDFAFGYDTLGIKRFFDGGFKNPLSLIDGFFIDDLNTSGVDIPEVHFGGGITASAEINLGVAKAGVGGGIFFTVDFNLHDPDEDGKIRLYELATNFLNEFKYGEPALSPLAVFDVTGRIFAKLFAYLKIDLLLFSVDKEFNITPEITIVDFDIPFTRIPTLATELPDGVLQLNMGKYSKDRLEGNENDIAEQFFVKQSGAGKVKVWAPNLGVTESMAQEYDVDSRIIALGGEGDDIIDLSQVTDTNIVAEVEGGTGNDIIRLGAGRGIVKGGDGDDTIEGSDLADIIYGEGGADKISGKGGNDFIAADKARLDKEEVVLSAGASLADGADIVDGGAGDDIIIGGGGADVIGGDADPGTAPGADTPAGNDVIFADGVVFTLTAAGDFFSFDPATVKDTNKGASGGADIVFGNGGNDRIWGGKGDDTIQGNTGDDTIFGEDGFDTLQGNDGADTIDGGKQDNTILGGAGNDTLIGGDNKDFIRGNTGQDTIRGGAGSDEIYGDEEDDTIFGESDADKIYGGGGADIIDGGAGNNLIFGDDKDGENTGTAGGDTITTLNDSNTIHGQDGDDVITSGDGLDLIFGDAGNDTIQAGGGKDLVFGGVGNDIIRAGAGNDRVLGEDGNDTVFGDAGIDEILGGLGNDLLYGGIGEAGGDTGANSIDGGLGDDQIWGDLGNDTILGDDGSDTIHGLAGNDDIDGGDDLDHIFGDDGDDRIIGGFGNDDLHGGGGQDIIWGGFEKVGRANFDLNVSSNFINPFAFDLNEARFDTGFVPPRINAVALDNLSVDGDLADGQDSLHGDGGIDFLFGGFDTDDLFGGDDSDYLDGGVSDDIVRGERGDDVIRGGGNNDTLFGGTGIDQLYGDSGADFLYGDAGRDNDAGVVVNGIGGDQSAVNGQQAGQRLYGGDGVDRLHAYSDVRLIDGDAAIAAETARIGDELHGGSGNDLLFGNLRQDTLLGDDGNDYLHGDRLAGPVYGDSVLADIIGGSDLLFGGSGQDQLFGGGGDDDLWGGADGDRIKGQNGIDRLYGGGGIDLLLMDVETEYDPLPAGVNEVFDGHFGNDFENDVLDDNATDILEIKGSNEYDTILLGQLADGRLHVDYTRENPVLSTFRRDFYTAVWLDADGNPLVEQFQVEGQGGNDTIAFRDADAVVNGTQVLKLDLSLLAARSDDFVGVFDGGPGNDTLIGGAARDRLDGGTGDDTMYGFGGDDRLWGGVGSTSDVDYLYGGQGNDDAIGGSGRNFLFAWSRDPKAGGQFGVYVDAQGGLHDNDGDLDNDGRLDSDATKT
ncbi:MAG: hypothetical protein JNL33_04830, partial [Betaproteobacteria bacterium]|nr:hypothetical protein [Betaproteobacteria bacterium]